MKNNVLIIGKSNDHHIPAISWGLNQLDISHTIFDFSDFPIKNDISFFIENELNPYTEIYTSNKIINEKFSSVLYRGIGKITLSDSIHEDDVNFANKEARDYALSILPYLTNNESLWVNDFAFAEAAENKIHQLVIAEKCGFNIPKTIISSRPETIRNFSKGRNIVHKCLNPHYWKMDNGGELIVKTSILSKEDLSDDDSLSLCPAIYQEYIKKNFELRITIMGEKIFPIKIIPYEIERFIDWRYDCKEIGLPDISPAVIPEKLEEMCLKLCKELKLKFACIDLIYSNSDEYFFLEINQQGQFLWIEQILPEINLLENFCDFLKNPKNPNYSKKHGIRFQDFVNYFKKTPPLRVGQNC